MHPQDMWKEWQPIHVHVYTESHHVHPWVWLGGSHILQSLGQYLSWYDAWMESIQIYVLHPRLVRPFFCIHKICAMYSHPYITPVTLYHSPHFHVDAFVVFQILPDLGQHLRRSVTWMESIPVWGLHPRPVVTFPWIHKTSCEMYVNPSMTTIHCITTLNSLGMAWWFANTAKPWPTFWEVCGLDGGHPYL